MHYKNENCTTKTMDALQKRKLHYKNDGQIWMLKLCTTKTMLAAFHLNNNEAKREIKQLH